MRFYHLPDPWALTCKDWMVLVDNMPAIRDEEAITSEQDIHRVEVERHRKARYYERQYEKHNENMEGWQ